MFLSKTITKLFKFGITGLFGVFIDFTVTWVCLTNFGMHYLIANGAGFCIAASNNYLINSYWTFSTKKSRGIGKFLIFLLISSAGLLLNSFCVFFLKDIWNLELYFAKLLSIGIVFTWNFIANSVFTFEEKLSFDTFRRNFKI